MDAIYSDFYPTFLYVDKYRFPRNWTYAPTPVPYALFRYVISGTAVFGLGDTSYNVAPGDVFYIPQGSMLSCEALEEIVFISVRFVGSVQMQHEDLFRSLWHIPIQYSFADKPEMRQWFEAMYASALTRHTYKMLEVRGYLNLICAELARLSPENSNGDLTLIEDRKNMEALFDVESIQRRASKSAQLNDPRITIIVDYITTHPEENLTREQMCEMTQVSEATLRRLFKAQTGKTIYDFVKDTKMTNAARRLLVTNEQISQIGYDLGYKVPSYFAKSFHEVFGVSPQEYRKISHDI